jgi:hypothetical protein
MTAAFLRVTLRETVTSSLLPPPFAREFVVAPIDGRAW